MRDPNADKSFHSLGVSDYELYRFDEEMMDEPDFLLEQWAEKTDAVREGVYGQAKRWTDLTDREKRILRAGGVLAKKQRLAKQQQAEKAEQQAQQDAFNADLQAYKTAQRKAFPGTDAQFEKVWDQLEREFIADHIRSPIERNKEILRRSGRYG